MTLNFWPPRLQLSKYEFNASKIHRHFLTLKFWPFNAAWKNLALNFWPSNSGEQIMTSKWRSSHYAFSFMSQANFLYFYINIKFTWELNIHWFVYTLYKIMVLFYYRGKNYIDSGKSLPMSLFSGIFKIIFFVITNV